MQTITIVEESSAKEVEVQQSATNASLPEMEIGLLTGCKDRPYVFGLATALASNQVHADIIASDEIDSPELHNARLRFLNFRGSHNRDASFAEKLSKEIAYYFALMHYAARSSAKILHILWNNKFEFFDRTILMLYYKALGKKIAFTAHNVNQAQRDSKDSWLNRVTLRDIERIIGEISQCRWLQAPLCVGLHQLFIVHGHHGRERRIRRAGL